MKAAMGPKAMITKPTIVETMAIAISGKYALV